MSTEGLKIVIGADVSKGVAGLNDLNKALTTTTTASGKTAVALGKLPVGANQAGNAISNLSRVAQDAPFGFIGIQNNLNPLLESFQRLKQETGTTGAALRSLAGSLAGPAGVGFALAAVSSLITVAVQKYGSLGNAIDALFGSTNAAALAQRDLAKSFAEAEGKAAGEIASINAVLNVARDETLSKQARTEAINKLNQEYDKYLPKLSLENINTQAVTSAVDKLTNSLLRQAKIRGLQDLISKETAKQAELMTKSLGENASAIDNIVSVVKSLGTGGNFFTEQQLQGAKRAGETFSESQKRIEIFNNALKDLTKEEAINGTLFVEKEKKAQDLLKKRIEALKQLQSLTGLTSAQQVELAQLEIQLAERDAVKLGFTQSELKQQIEGILERAFPVKTFVFNLEAQPDLKLLPAKIPTNLDIPKALNLDKIPLDFAGPIVEKMKLIGEKMKELKLEEQAKAQAVAIAGVLTPAFDGLFTAILDGQNAFDAVGDAIRRLISDMVKAVIRAAALAAIFSLIFPASKGGSSFFGAFKNLLGGGFKDGGVATGPSSGYLALLHGTELVIPMNKIGQANAAGVQGAAFDQPIILQPSVAIQGQALRILLNRVDATNGRLF